jgi:hypothetical protein
MKKNESKKKMINMKVFRGAEGKRNRDKITMKILR